MSPADKAAQYRERAKEFRVLAESIGNEAHRKLLLEAAGNYERMAETEMAKREARGRKSPQDGNR